MAGGPDEYQDISLYKLENGNNLHPYFWKPPLHTWTIAIFYKIFGMSEFTSRLPSFIFAILSLVLIFKISKYLFPKSIYAPYISTIIFSSSSDFSFLSSQGIAEMQLLFFSLSTIYFTLKKQYILAGLLFGLGLLTKSFALFWLIPVLIYIALIINKSKLSSLLRLFLVSFLIAFPWHLLMYLKFKDIFIQNYFWANLLGRGSGQAGNIAPIYWYLKYILTYHTFLLLTTPVVLVYAFKNFNNKVFLFLFWIATVFIPFSLMSSKVWWYIFPIFTPLSIIIAQSLEKIITQKRNLFMATLLIFILICQQTSKQTLTRTNFNQSIKNLAQNNPQVTSLSVYKMPYEAPLFYFDVGKIYVNFETATDYLLINKDYIDEIDKSNWHQIDSSLGVYLLQHL